MNPNPLLALTAVLSIALGGCNSRTADPATAPPVVAAPPTETRIADQWLGRWVGPEGTLLDLARQGEGYEIKIQSLDGPNTYVGKAVSDHLEFQRNGVLESIHAGNGADTGMKWLAEKTHCLIIRQSEGFCRD